MKQTLLFACCAVGAFLLGVYPGMVWLNRFAATSPRMLGSFELTILVFLFALAGAFSGAILFRVVSWTAPTWMDVWFAVINGLLFGFWGFIYSLALAV